jgi:hypothetical protein
VTARTPPLSILVATTTQYPRVKRPRTTGWSGGVVRRSSSVHGNFARRYQSQSVLSSSPIRFARVSPSTHRAALLVLGRDNRDSGTPQTLWEIPLLRRNTP